MESFKMFKKLLKSLKLVVAICSGEKMLLMKLLLKMVPVT